MKGTPMTEPTYEYVIQRFGKEERELLRAMARRAERAGMPLIMIGEDQARFLRILLPAMGAKTCLDVGALFGYSAAVMAQSMGSKGKVVSLELEPRHAEVARENLAGLGLGKQVDVEVGAALDLMKKLKASSFDFVLIDAEKTGYVGYFEESLRLVRPGGIIAADNTLAWGRVAEPPAALREEPDVVAIQRFNDHVAKSKDVVACLLPIGDGLLVARVKD